MNTCSVDGCGRKTKAKGLCSKHYLQSLRYGKVLERSRADPNEIFVNEKGEHLLKLYNKQHVWVASSILDEEDIDRIKNIRWHLFRCKTMEYAMGSLLGKHILLHRFILGFTTSDNSGVIIDHVNRNGLDNRKANLRICDKSKNAFNSKGLVNNRKSKYKGLYWHKRNRKWISRITVNGKVMNLGCFISEEAAAISYDRAALKYHGEFACLNILNGK